MTEPKRTVASTMAEQRARKAPLFDRAVPADRDNTHHRDSADGQPTGGRTVASVKAKYLASHRPTGSNS